MTSVSGAGQGSLVSGSAQSFVAGAGARSPPALTVRLVRRFRAWWPADVKQARAGRAGGEMAPRGRVSRLQVAVFHFFSFSRFL